MDLISHHSANPPGQTVLPSGTLDRSELGLTEHDVAHTSEGHSPALHRKVRPVNLENASFTTSCPKTHSAARRASGSSLNRDRSKLNPSLVVFAGKEGDKLGT
jgi:hypothetical protein